MVDLNEVAEFVRSIASRDVRVDFNCDGELVLEVVWINSGFGFDDVDAKYKKEELFEVVDQVEDKFLVDIRDGFGDDECESVIIALFE